MAVWLATATVGFAESPVADASAFPRTIVVNSPTDAYDPNDPAKQIGTFQANSELKVTEFSEAHQAYRVEFTDKASGNIIHAWCKAAVIGSYFKEDTAKTTASGADGQKTIVTSMFGSKPEAKADSSSKDRANILTARIAGKVEKRTASFWLSLQNDETRDFIKDAQKNKKKLPASLPKFKIVDESDKVLETGRFEYG